MKSRQIGTVMLTEGRSGSSWLGSLITQIGTMGNSSEWLDPKLLGLRNKAASPEDYLRKVVSSASTENGRFALKVFPRHILWFSEVYRADFLAICAKHYETYFVRLTRSDRLLQAISLVRAAQSGRWSSNAKATGRSEVFDSSSIARAIHFIERSEAFWNSYELISGLSPERFTYEDLLANPSPFLDWCSEKLDVSYDHNIVSKYIIQRDAETENWARQFKKITSEGGLSSLDVGPDLKLNFRNLRSRGRVWSDFYSFK